MGKYKIQITEKLQKIVEVEAKNEDDAIDMVNHLYAIDNIVLDFNDHIETEIEFVEYNK